jgi:hypothetical protein
MRSFKLTAFSLLLSLPLIALLSCNGTSDLVKDFVYAGTTSMSGAQETPAVATTATGTINASYNKQTKILSYTVTFSGLAQAASAAHIHVTGEAGIFAGVLQSFIGFPPATAGTYSGTVLIDGVKFLENELLGGRYYINIHNPTWTNGEIRGQIILSKL